MWDYFINGVMHQIRSPTVLQALKFGRILLPCIALFLAYRKFVRHRMVQNSSKLQGKVVLITGASSGLGEALAHAFYAAGSKVILASRRTEELERVRGALLASHALGPTYDPTILPLDLTDLKTISAKASDALAIHGTVDILVNNSGVSSRSDVLSTSLDVDINLMTVNYFGHVALTKALLQTMIQNGGGHIVAVSSIQGRIGIPHRSSYAASKHAMQAFFDVLRAEMHDKNVAVTVAILGYIRTNLSINAVLGSGSKYNVMDVTTATGLSPEVAASKILDAVVQKDKELILAPFSNKLAIVLRAVYPKLFFYMMKKRAQTSEPVS